MHHLFALSSSRKNVVEGDFVNLQVSINTITNYDTVVWIYTMSESTLSSLHYQCSTQQRCSVLAVNRSVMSFFHRVLTHACKGQFIPFIFMRVRFWCVWHKCLCIAGALTAYALNTKSRLVFKIGCGRTSSVIHIYMILLRK